MRSEAAAFYRNPSGDVVADATNGMIYSATAYNKICEYLHKQLVRKGRAPQQIFIDTQKWGRVYYCKDLYIAHENERRYYVNGYRLDTGGLQPYAYDGSDNLGLSQFFAGQKPTAPYSGPSDGQITDYFWIKKTKFSNFRIACKYSGRWNQYEIYRFFSLNRNRPIEKIIALCGITNYQIVKEFYDETKNMGGEFIDLDEGICYFYYMWFPDPNHQEGEHGGRPSKMRLGCTAYPLFYADSNSPVMGSRKWVKKWSQMYKLVYDRKSKGKFGKWGPIISFGIIAITFVLAAVTVGTYGPAAGATIGALAGGAGAVTVGGVMATLAVAGAIGGFIATIGSLSGKKSLAKFGRVMGFIGAIGSIYLSVKSLFTQSVAAQNASTATNQAVAGASGANQTCQLYNGVSPSSWIGSGSSAGLGYAATQGASIGGFAAAGATSTSQLYLTTALKVVGIGSKAFALVQDIRSEFRKHGDTQDTDMQEQSEDEKVISVSGDAQQDEGDVTRRFYERDAEYDIGLTGGTLISIDDSVLDEPNSAVKSI
ncbi:MAG: hypothetical protein KH703_00315 [Campylobacter gracilis]|uniref:hypothetical protein n=1 Tax=Campylobacter gracilis TaxID=824 RepID=UPI0026EF4ADF|nr:hypothetical protein [Campylobacter gracilis]MBS6151857.1 hypothetical protein [Campylobacter gracilis]